MRKAPLHQSILSARQELPINIWHKHSVFNRKVGMVVTALVVFAVGLFWLSETNGISGLNAHPFNFDVNKKQPSVESQTNGGDTLNQQFAKTNDSEQNIQGDQDTIELLALDAAMVNLGHPEKLTISNDERSQKFQTWRRWLTENRLGSVRYALRRHLKSNPEDVDAWSLLVDCEHRAKRWRAEIRNLKKVASLTTDQKNRQAMFIAASIAQENDDNTTAAQILKQYLRRGESPLPMKAEAFVRLVYAYRRIGLKEESEEMWRTFLKNHASAPLSRQGRKMFAELSNQRTKTALEN